MKKTIIEQNYEMNITHKELTDEECFQNVKQMHKENPDIVMQPDEWKKQRLIVLQKKGLLWSK